MGIIEFKFDVEKDLRNIWDTANSKKHYNFEFKEKLPKEILEICENKKYEKCKKELLEKRNPLYKNPLIKIMIKSLKESWVKIEKEYFVRLEKITGKKFAFKKVKAYLTTSNRCPYDYNPKNPSFFFGIYSNFWLKLASCGHELMHIHLHNSPWWIMVEDEIGREKTEDLKESMTILLDLEFRDLWIVKDLGYIYPNHVKLREYIASEWKKKRDFNLLIKKCIKWIQKNGVK